jgi:hypothetical protein
MLTLEQAFQNLCITSKKVSLDWDNHQALEQSRQIVQAALEELVALKAAAQVAPEVNG